MFGQTWFDPTLVRSKFIWSNVDLIKFYLTQRWFNQISIWSNVFLIKCCFDLMLIWSNVALIKCWFDQTLIWSNVDLTRCWFDYKLIRSHVGHNSSDPISFNKLVFYYQSTAYYQKSDANTQKIQFLNLNHSFDRLHCMLHDVFFTYFFQYNFWSMVWCYFRSEV